MTYKLFFAWQDQDKTTKNYLLKQLEKAVELISTKYEFDVDIIKSPTQDDSGSPNIVDRIWEQIKDCDVLIADTTHIVEYEDEKSISNPNVMYEIGIADALLGDRRTILLCSNLSDISKLAFDINQKRISKFKIDNISFYKSLAKYIVMAIKESINQYYYKRYICKSVTNNLEYVYNNFFRLIYNDCNSYEDDFFNIDKEYARARMAEGIFDILQIKVDYTPIILSIEKSIKELYATKERELINLIIVIMEKLREYHFINSQTNYNQFEQTSDREDLKYNLQDSNSFFLEEPDETLINAMFFREDTAILSIIEPAKPSVNLFHRDTILQILENECNISVQHNMTIAKLQHYKFKDSANIEKYSGSVFSIIKAIENLLQYLNLSINIINESNGKRRYAINFIEARIVDTSN